MPKNSCFWIVLLEKTLESPLGSKEIKPVNPKGNQPWIFIGGTDVEAKAPILWPPDMKSQLTGKDPDAGKDWRQEEKGTTEDEMVGWHHQLNGHELEQIPGDGDGQGSLVCCSPWGRKESDMTERWNTTTTMCKWITLLCTWDTVSQLYLNITYILRKKLRTELPLRSSYPTSGHLYKEYKDDNLKRYTHPLFIATVFYTGQNMEITLRAHQQMNNDMTHVNTHTHTHNRILLRKKKSCHLWQHG